MNNINHICCDGECNHDACCGKVSENCPNFMELNPKVIKIRRLEKLLSCHKCKPHQGDNRTKTVRHKTRKSHNHQEVWK